jgi:D-alanyl-D-alanine carboxypeptidase
MTLSMSFAAVVSLVLSPAFQTATPTAPATARAVDKTLEARVDAIAAEFLKKPGAVGLSIGVARKGEVLLEKGYGLADAEFDVPADGETMFRIGSVTKQFTSAAILLQIEQGHMKLDDTLEKLVPEFPTPGHTVTLRQLLNHTSGIPSYTDIGDAWEAKWPLELKHEELLALVKDKPFDFEPGSDWRYNNTGYYLLGMALEKASGKSYAVHVKKTLFEPLGLKRTRYDSNSELIKNRAQGYTLVLGRLVNDQPLGVAQPGAAGGLISTGGDLVRWQMALTSGRVVKPESYALMTTPTVLPNGKDTGYGFGLMIDTFEGKKRIQHGGGIFGFNSMLLWLPGDDVHVAVISNGEPLSSGKVANDVTYAALGIEKPKVKDEPTTPALRQKFAGNYRIEDLKLDTKVFEEGDRLRVQATGQKAFGLKWQGANSFRADFDTDVELEFAADSSSFTLHQGGGVFQAKRMP